MRSSLIVTRIQDVRSVKVCGKGNLAASVQTLLTRWEGETGRTLNELSKPVRMEGSDPRPGKIALPSLSPVPQSLMLMGKD